MQALFIEIKVFNRRRPETCYLACLVTLLCNWNVHFELAGHIRLIQKSGAAADVFILNKNREVEEALFAFVPSIRAVVVVDHENSDGVSRAVEGSSEYIVVVVMNLISERVVGNMRCPCGVTLLLSQTTTDLEVKIPIPAIFRSGGGLLEISGEAGIDPPPLGLPHIIFVKDGTIFIPRLDNN